MPVLTKVEAKSRMGRSLHTGIFIILILGGLTMIYPFLLMFSGSMRSDMDISEMDIVPDFITDDTVLVRKFMETKYNYNPQQMNHFRQSQAYSFAKAQIPDVGNPNVIKDFTSFTQDSSMPHHWEILGGTKLHKLVESKNFVTLTDRLKTHFSNDLARASEDMGIPLNTWQQLQVRIPEWHNPRFAYMQNDIYNEYFVMMRERPLAERAFINLTGVFLESIIFPEYGINNPDKYNAAHTKPIESYAKFAISQRIPPASEPQLQKEWLEFVYDNCHVSFVRADISNQRYRTFLKESAGSIERLRELWVDSNITSFDNIKLPDDHDWVPSSQVRLYGAFLETLEPESLRLVGPEFAWQDWLKNRYNNLAALNKAHTSNYQDWSLPRMPIDQVEAAYVKENASTLRWQYATRNFRTVIRQMFIQGRPFTNTLIYVTLALLFSLTIQPLAAYSLSRFSPPGMWKMIFIFMATMAFPPMVSTLPMFLMIKNFHLLNTFIALVLPVTINGYLIFLLKGFFDSIPNHLYEAASIEGASEFYIFWHISMALSKPILAVVALNTFRMVWMSFMYPLIVCPDEKMHVLSVWLHQFQQHAPTSAIFASILVASLPTLMIFLFTQNTIMKGIAVPAEK